MMPSRLKWMAFTLEGLNAVSTTYYFYYVFFLLRDHFGFSSRENLLWAIGHGAVFTVASWQGGRLGQRFGYLCILRLGFGVMTTCFLAGWLVSVSGIGRTAEIVAQSALMLVATAGLCFTWPNLEALVSDGEPRLRLQRLVGLYNLIWAGGSALAYFTGGALMEWLGGRNLIFAVPCVMIAGQWVLAAVAQSRIVRSARLIVAEPARAVVSVEAPDAGSPASPVSPRTFLWLGWLSNPCAYIAISAAIPMIPSLAATLGLSPSLSGFFCSIWFFARAGTFLVLWRWAGWHYRFGWLAGAFIGMTAGFLFIFLSAEMQWLGRAGILIVASAAQVVFGMGLGLIYYSSLFYSMDVGETKGDHGGFHEAAIGVGVFSGPVVGAAAQWVMPGSTAAAACAVSLVLLGGFAGLLWLRYGRGARTTAASGARTVARTAGVE